MKKVIVFNLILMCTSIAFAQKKKSVDTQTQPIQQPVEVKPESAKTPGGAGDHAIKKRVIATRWNDFDVAKDAMYDLIIEDPGNDSLIFQLAYLYYENQKYPSSILVCKDLLARNPKNTQVLELSAISYESLNIFDRALQSYESMFLLTNSSSTLYKMAFLQYELKRYPECMTNADILLSRPDAETLKVGFNTAENKPKEYPIKVALLNLKGMVYKDQGDKVNAKTQLDEALKIAPDFLPAKQTLDSLK